MTTGVVRPVTSSTVNHLPTAKPKSVRYNDYMFVVIHVSIAGEFFFNAAYRPVFNEVRGHFGILIDELVPLISQSIPSAAKMKSFLQLSFPELSAELSNTDSIEGIMNVVVKN